MTIIKCAHKVCTILLALCKPTIKWVPQLLVVLFMANSNAQELVMPQDSIITVNLDEVILISARKTLDYHRQANPKRRKRQIHVQ